MWPGACIEPATMDGFSTCVQERVLETFQTYIYIYMGLSKNGVPPNLVVSLLTIAIFGSLKGTTVDDG